MSSLSKNFWIQGDRMNDKELLNKMEDSIIQGDKEEAERLAREALSRKMDLSDVVDRGYVPGIQKVGELWQKGEYFLPELITSAECMKAAMGVLEPEFKRAQKNIKSIGKVVIGTVQGDIHDIGKNLVSAMLSANGFEVIDLGADVAIERFIQKAEEESADFICLSALLTTTMLGQKQIIEMLKERNLYGHFKVLVGGAPVNQRWAKEIGADGYAENAVAAVKLAKELLEK